MAADATNEGATRHSRLAAFAFALVIASVSLVCVVSSASAQFVVNTETSGDQDEPAVARAADGGFLVAWRSVLGGIRAQRYDEHGSKVGIERVVGASDGVNRSPSAALLRGGGFLIAWNRILPGADKVIGRVLDSQGVPLEGDFEIAAGIAAGSRPDIAVNDKGRGLVVWAADDGDSTGVSARRFRADGSFPHDAFAVNSYTTGAQTQPRVAALRPLRYVVVWSDAGARDGSGSAVIGRRLNRLGNAIGSEFIINSYTTGDQRAPDAVRAEGRRFLVVWEAGESATIGPFGYAGAVSPGIRARRFGPRARKLGDELVVNTFDYGPHFSPAVDATDGDGFVVVWAQGADYMHVEGVGSGCGSPGSSGYPAEHRCQDGVGLGVIAQRLDASGAKVGEEVVLTEPGFDQHQPAVATVPPGRFVVAWSDAGCLSTDSNACRYGSSADGDGSGVVALVGETGSE